MMEVIIFKGFWKVTDAQRMNNYLFVFGDNDVRKGKGGQAIIRDEPNAVGIPTKKAPNNALSSFYKDDEYEQNILKIDSAIQKIVEKLSENKGKYSGIVLPEDGFGTGLAKLSVYAPKTLDYVNERVDVLKKTVQNIS